jgi:glutamate racemase
VKDLSVGFFDSGIGGLTVLKQALKKMPEKDYIYYADTDNVPYGVKAKDEVRGFVSEAARFIVDQGVQALVIACNTATSVVIEDLRRKYFVPIIGMEPAVKPAVEKNGSTHKRVLVLATKLTLMEEKFLNLVKRIDDERIIDSFPLPELVILAENKKFEEDAVGPYLKKALAEFDFSGYGTVVLGCTHFVFFKEIFKKILPQHIEVIDGNEGTVNNLKRILEANGSNNKESGRITFYESGRKVSEQAAVEEYFRLLERVP